MVRQLNGSEGGVVRTPRLGLCEPSRNSLRACPIRVPACRGSVAEAVTIGPCSDTGAPDANPYRTQRAISGPAVCMANHANMRMHMMPSPMIATLNVPNLSALMPAARRPKPEAPFVIILV